MAKTRKNGCVRARKFDSKGNAVSEFLEPPASFVAARTFVVNDASPPSRQPAELIYSICVPLQHFLKYAFIQWLVALAAEHIKKSIAA
jgi:hypothetical protein